jgi:hypothetical protein
MGAGEIFSRSARQRNRQALRLTYQIRPLSQKSVSHLLRTAFLVIGVPLSAQTTPIDIPTARLYFTEAEQLAAADAGRLWGKRVAGPILFVDAASGLIVANRADRDGKFEARDGVWIGQLPEGMAPANTGIDIAGTRWAMIMWPVPDNRYTRARLLMHESFHRIQDSLGIPGTNPGNAHLAAADGRIWLRLEMRALAEALLRTGDEKRNALLDALTFRAKRYSLFPGAAEEERQLELNEGLAEYTGYKLSGLPVGVVADRVAVHLVQQEQQESQSRSFAYATGPAYALLLDEAGGPWRRSMKASSSLASHAVAAYRIGNVRESDAEARVAAYAGARMIAFEKAREANRIAQEARLRARFLDGPALSLPVASRFNFSFNPNGAVPIAGLGTVYESSRISDEWGTLDVSSGGVLMIRNEKGHITEVIVSSPTVKDRIVQGEGWRLTLAPGWSATESATKKGRVVVSRM